MDFLADLGQVGALLGGAAYFTHVLVNGLTLAFPLRASWVAWLSAILLGVIFTALFALAVGVAFTTQTTAQMILVGILAGAGAGGANETQASADRKRRAAITAERIVD